MAGLIAMIAVFLVVTIEMTFSTMNGGSMGGCHSGPGLPGYDPVAPTSPGHSRVNSVSVGMIPTILEEAPDGTVRGVRPASRHRRSGSIGTELQKIERGGMGMGAGVGAGGNEVWDKSESDDSEDDSGGDAPETQALNGGVGAGVNGGRPRSWSESSQRGAGRTGSRLTEDQQQQKQLLQVMLLEAGILFHSVFIGKDQYPPPSRGRILTHARHIGGYFGGQLSARRFPSRVYTGLILTQDWIQAWH